MPNRILREGILTSPRINRLSLGAEVFYRRVMSIVDDFGRYQGHPQLLRAACFPRRLDDVTDVNITAWLAECEAADLLMLYVHHGERYIELADFRQFTRAKASKFPAPATHENIGKHLQTDARIGDAVEMQPDGTCNADAVQTQRTHTASARLYGDGDGDVKKKEHAAQPSAAPPKKGHRLPESWKPDANLIAWSHTEHPDVDPVKEADAFADYWRGIPGQRGCKTDWNGAFRNWIRRANGNPTRRLNGTTAPKRPAHRNLMERGHD